MVDRSDQSAEELVRLSIVVPCRNEVREIRRFLGSVLQQDLTGLDCEIIIADGDSNDGTKEVLEAYRRKYHNVRLVRNEERTVSAGLNKAIRMSRGDIILRMDVHTEYAPDYCRRCVDTLMQTSADNVGGPARTRFAGVIQRAIAAVYHSPFSTGGTRFHDETYKGYVDTVPYGCWRKSTLERIGLFDQALVRNQDDELNLRLVRSGGKVWQAPEIVSWYRPRSTLSGLFRQYFQYGFWKVAVIRKHRIPASWRHLVPVVFILCNVMLLVALALAAIGLNKSLFRNVLILLTMDGLYLLLSLSASLLAARHRGWVLFPFLPIVFAVYHVSYGVGFVLGLLNLCTRSEAKVRPATIFTEITR